MEDTAPERLDLKGCPPIIKEPRKERMTTRFILPVKTRRKIYPDYLPFYFGVISSTGEILMAIAVLNQNLVRILREYLSAVITWDSYQGRSSNKSARLARGQVM
ncbi:hypothetical protein NPIL_573541 [Nephila pilipes]|uniref:Uncharacterized protein n=1 Tax=Nephila pilipes TaxID=299642 RepID=A0A8X6TF05_NEPPI|nr:hypothetical protein NPIL_573541 [Nephila pilipes]